MVLTDEHADWLRRMSPAERRLVGALVAVLSGESPGDEPPRILNVGAGPHTVFEQLLVAHDVAFVGDRMDVLDCRAEHPAVGQCWTCRAEDMSPVPSGAYRAVFANFVLEHVRDVEAVVGEVARVLAPGGRFITTVPNPRAPEFLLSRATPMWFHRLVTRRKTACETFYTYRSIPGLVAMLAEAGLDTVEVDHFSYVEGYARRLPLLCPVGWLYDRLASVLSGRALRGNVAIVGRKSISD